MKTILLFVFLCCAPNMQAQIADLYKMSDPGEKKTSLRHVVLFKFKEGTPADAIEEIENAFAALPSKIPEILTFEWGLNTSAEGLDKGFTHCYILTFASEAGRDVYLPHPDHRKFGEVLSPWLEDVLVVDYLARPEAP